MTDISKEAVERLAQTVRDRGGSFPDANVFDDAAATLLALLAALDTAEAEKCEEVEALVRAGDTLALRLSHIVGKEDIVKRWEAQAAALRARLGEDK